ncbi:IclR family transcriptional regulator [Propionibacteriaceae bacterium Y1923]|uniref:IclR family transcriptional regulator n=1 Tax=Aestuariimicrobium sp. Y1814 TaxID=3418742 RepID=UPI003C23FD39
MSEPQIPSVLQNALRVLEAVGEAGPAGTDAAEIEGRTGLHRRSIYRHLSSLKSLGMVSDATRPAHYRLGPSIAALAQNASDQREFLRRARLFCEELSGRTHEPVHVTVLDQGTAVTVASASADSEISKKSPPIVLGSRRPLHASASGKVFLAFNPSALEAYRVRPLETFTPHTIATMEQLYTECLEVRNRGYALDRQELLLGVTCVAVPVHGINGRAVGTLAVSTKNPVMSASRRRELLRALLPAAQEFTGAIGGSTP